MNGKRLASTRNDNLKSVLAVCLMLMFTFCFVPVSHGATAKEIEGNVDAAL